MRPAVHGIEQLRVGDLPVGDDPLVDQRGELRLLERRRRLAGLYYRRRRIAASIQSAKAANQLLLSP